MSGWRLVNSIAVLFSQINRAYPGRSKASDGTIGDSNHSATSDHTPHIYLILGSTPVVCAGDITHDPDHGVDTVAISEWIRRSRDPRVAYIIAHGRIFSNHAVGSTPAWEWREYNDTPDPHVNHMHVSTVHDGRADHTNEWSISAPTPLRRSDPMTNLYRVKDGGDLTGAPAGAGAIYQSTNEGPKSITGAEFMSMSAPVVMYVDSYARIKDLCPVLRVTVDLTSPGWENFAAQVAAQVAATIGAPVSREERVQEAFEGAQKAETE